MRRWLRYGLVAVVVVGLALPAAASVTVFKGDSILIEDAASEIIWGKDYTFDIDGFVEYSDALGFDWTDSSLGFDNISVTSNTSAQLNTTLWTYQPNSFSDGDDVFKITSDAAGGTNVTYNFTMQTISSGVLKLYRDGVNTQNFSSGGFVVWYESSWSEHNFTLTYASEAANHINTLDVNGNIVEEDTDILTGASNDYDITAESRAGHNIIDADVDSTASFDYNLFTATTVSAAGVTFDNISLAASETVYRNGTASQAYSGSLDFLEPGDTAVTISTDKGDIDYTLTYTRYTRE